MPDEYWKERLRFWPKKKEDKDNEDTACEKCESFEEHLCCRKEDGSCDMFKQKDES